MPIYDFVCKSCGVIEEHIQKISDPAPEKCGTCGVDGTMNKILGASTFQLKGDGWGKDNYSKSHKTSADPKPVS